MNILARSHIVTAMLGALPVIVMLLIVPDMALAQGASDSETEFAITRGCPEGWVASRAPGGCSPEFLTLKLARIPDTDDCPDGWVRSSVPGGCSPEFLTLVASDPANIDECPKGWVISSAPGGCSPGYLTLKLIGIEPVTEGCPVGWVESSAPGGCSPDSFTLRERRILQPSYTCAFGMACDMMVEAILALGGSCERDGPDSTCDLPPLVDGD